MTDNSQTETGSLIADLMQLDASDELKKMLIENELNNQKHKNELERLEITGALDVKKSKSLFWISSGFIGLVSAILTLVLGEAFGVLRLGSEQSHELLLNEREFERNMIQQALSVNDNEARVDALRLLVKADLLPGLTEDELNDYEHIVGDRGIPNITSPIIGGFILSDEDRELAEIVGAPGSVPLVKLSPPFPMKLSWDRSSKIETITFNAYGACALKRALQRIGDHYGEQIDQLEISNFGGAYNLRKMLGSNRPSNHAFGTAIDLYPEGNPLRATSKTAAFARPEYKTMIDIFEDEGFVSKGREFDYDWMEFRVSLDILRKKEDPASCGIN